MANKEYADSPQELQDFLFYMLTIRGRSRRTVNGYHIDLRMFLRYIRKINSDKYSDLEIDEIEIETMTLSELTEITLSDVYSFLNFTMATLGNNSRTRARKVSSIRAFFKYLTVTANLMEENPVKDLEMPAIKKSLPKYLSLEESLELLTNVETANPERDYCLITLMLNCGMRVSELTGINVPDIKDNTLRILGKGNKERIIYLNDACLHAIAEYMKVRPVPPTGKDRNALFVSREGNRISVRRVQQILDECLKNAGLDGKGYSPHKLRHTAATLMYQHGNVDIRVLQELLGHEQLGTTEIYTHVSSKQLEDAASNSPLSNIKIDNKKTMPEKIE